MVEEYIFGEDFEIKQKNSNLIKSDSFETGGASIRPSKFSCQFHPVEVQFAECLLPERKFDLELVCIPFRAHLSLSYLYSARRSSGVETALKLGADNR